MKSNLHHNIIVTLILISNIVYLPFNLHAQSSAQKFNDIYFEKLTVEDGLSGNVVKCIMQDHLGFLWFGTADGLNRYDGKTFKIFKNDPSDVHSIGGNIITGITEDKKGCLWITTQDGGLSCYNRNAAKQFEQYKYDSKNKNSIPANNLNALTVDKDGNVWVATENSGVFKIDSKTRKIRGIGSQEGNTATSNFTYGCDVLKTDHKNKIWCGSYGNALVQLDPVRYTIKNYYYFESSKGIKLEGEYSVYCLFPDKSTLWFAHRFGALNAYNFTANTFEQYQLETEDVSKKRNDQWIAIDKDANGNIWLGQQKQWLLYI